MANLTFKSSYPFKKNKTKNIERKHQTIPTYYHHIETKSRQLCIEEFREKTNKLRVQRENKQTNKKNTKLPPSDCKPRDQNDISSQNASKREQKNRFCIKRLI